MSNTAIIKNVTKAIVQIVTDTSMTPAYTVLAGPPEKAAGVASATLIVYLYQVLESPTLKNSGPTATGLTGGGGSAQSVTVRRDPLALDLYYLLIPVAQDTDPAFLETYTVLGMAAQKMHDNGSFKLGQFVTLMAPDLDDVNTEFRISFNPLTTGQLFELWQAVNEPYRLSLSYIVRTVRIDSSLETGTPLVSQRNLQTTQA